MSSREPGRVDILRDFIVVHRALRALFERFRAGEAQFDEVDELVADGSASVLFRLKERCHALFRSGGDQGSPMRPEALFDLAVGSLFHEAMKFRENLYQLEVYGPKVLSLKNEGSHEADELLAEFEKILTAASHRIAETLEETEALLEQTRKQLKVLLRERPDGLVTRYLIEHRQDVEEVDPEGLESLLEHLHGDLDTGYLCAIRSRLESAHFVEATGVIAEARRASARQERPDLDALASYARGMEAFLQGDYGACVESLSAWVAARCAAPLDEPRDDAGFAAFATAAVGRIPELVDRRKHPELVAEAAELAERLD